MDKFVITLELDRTEMNALIFALGLATGKAMDMGMLTLADTIVEMTNKVNANNPAWTPYKTSQESKQ